MGSFLSAGRLGDLEIRFYLLNPALIPDGGIRLETLEFTPFMLVTLFIAFLFISYFMGIMIHAAWMYEDHPKMDRNSRKAWVLCMAAGTGVTGWLFAYGYYVNF
jgi:hypothetical protein